MCCIPVIYVPNFTQCIWPIYQSCQHQIEKQFWRICIWFTNVFAYPYCNSVIFTKRICEFVRLENFIFCPWPRFSSLTFQINFMTFIYPIKEFLKLIIVHFYRNPFRENDRVTIWIRKNIREPYANSPELFFNLMLARLINWPDTLSKIGYINNWNTAYVYNILENRRVSGQKFITGAYMLTGTFGKKGTPKSWQIAYHCLEQIWEMRREITPILKDNLQSEYNRMMEKHPPGFGGFLTYEIVTDLRHTRYLENADDIMTWAHAGPGCKRGINRLYDNDVRTNCPDD